MTINIFVLKGDLNGENRSGAFLFLSGILLNNNEDYAFCDNPVYFGAGKRSVYLLPSCEIIQTGDLSF